MTKLEVIKANRKSYEEQIAKNLTMSGLSRRVGETLVLEWIKGRNWMGGISDRTAEKIFCALEKEGYAFDDAYAEFNRQMEEFQ